MGLKAEFLCQHFIELLLKLSIVELLNFRLVPEGKELLFQSCDTYHQ